MIMVVQENAQITEAHFDEAKQRAYALLDNLDSSIIYHRKEHTTDSVVPASLAIAEAEGFTLEDKLLVGVAAAFHDTGFVKQYNANEPIGAQLAEEYIRASQHAYSEDHIANVKDAIENTNMKSPPQTKYARVIRDADLAILGHPDFIQWNEDLMKECRLHPDSPMHEASLDIAKWVQSQLGFISQFHHWFTEGAKSLYGQSKQQNISAFKKHYQLE